MTRIASRLLTVLAAVLVAVPLAPAGAPAQPTSPTLTWAVQPADEKGPDGRRWVEVALDPGQVVTEHLAVRNFSDGAVVFALKAADGYLTDKGRFNMLPSNRESVDGGTWIDVQQTVTVGPKQTKVVPFTITVPRDATPGDHPAGIAATVTSSGGTVAVESRVGFRVMMRATGTVTAALAIGDVAARYERSWNPFSAGTVHVTYTATNDGNVAVTGSGRVTAAELFGLAESNTRAAVEELLPGGSRKTEARVAGVWGLGPVRTTVEATPSVHAGDPTGAEIRRGSATVTVWVLPWPQLALVVVLAALVIACRIVVRRRRRRLARLLAQARDEGRAEARGATLAGGSPKTS
ncbi:WxL protein peptidoglycan domain-containing protein [Micromonospora avicenniae]|uniref:WxL protein peptidoglycan domain-containing protein n=1 Tax=Micromonospora avicenniae TaxID=1198245 RepID=UPI0033231958